MQKIFDKTQHPFMIKLQELGIEGIYLSLIKAITFANKGPSSQVYGFSSSHVWMWELDYKESWAPKNWCFWTVVFWKELLRESLGLQGDQTSQF